MVTSIALSYGPYIMTDVIWPATLSYANVSRKLVKEAGVPNFEYPGAIKSWITNPKHVEQQKQLYIDVGHLPSRYVLIGAKTDSLPLLTAIIGIASMLHYRENVLGFGAKLTRPTQANADWLQVLLL